MSVRVYVGNLSKDVQKEAFESLFAADQENIVSIKLITDRKTGKCRGFGFVTVKEESDADELVEKYNGHAFEGSELKVEKAMPRSKDGDDSQERRAGKKSQTRKPAAATDSGSVQPDPRWAQDLAKLKELLAAQTTAS